MDNSNKALSFEQARNLLPDEFRPNIELTGRKKLLNTPMGLAAYHYSSLLKGGVWKTSHNEEDIRNTVDYYCCPIKKYETDRQTILDI